MRKDLDMQVGEKGEPIQSKPMTRADADEYLAKHLKPVYESPSGWKFYRVSNHTRARG